ncbi:MAG TPA: hypothetical protein VF624_17535 [Tepidisphaeraceae bacterium]|jgi:hypothetical protein
MDLFPDHAVFAPGQVGWDHFVDLDPALPIEHHDIFEFDDDPFVVFYPNGMLLDVGYLLRQEPIFTVSIAFQKGPWRTVFERKCKSFEDVRILVLQMHPKARDWKV